ncbi:MAG TPA: ECF-type sigma factor [Gemmatimonas sp.]|uniref:ECF-type sigma factor n=1 Tax=Gemmatimonas sp. TaxID=1962908 RepID=UPI002ED97C5B
MSADQAALDALFSLTYEELHRLAQRVRRGEPGVSLSPTTLVNEAWLKLSATPAAANTSPLHFKRIAARAMRQVLVEAARRRQATKRGGRDAVHITLDQQAAPADASDNVIALHDALDRLALLAPRQAQLVESRYFGGLEVREAAELLGISESTALRDWRLARAWLARELQAAR